MERLPELYQIGIRCLAATMLCKACVLNCIGWAFVFCFFVDEGLVKKLDWLRGVNYTS